MTLAQQLVSRLAAVLTPQVTKSLGGYDAQAFARAIAKDINRDRETMPSLGSLLLAYGPVAAACNDTDLVTGQTAVLKAITCMVDKGALVTFIEDDVQRITWSSDVQDWINRADLRFGEPLLSAPSDHAVGVDGGNARNSISRRPATLLDGTVAEAMNVAQGEAYTVDQRVLAVMKNCQDLRSTAVDRAIAAATRVGLAIYFLAMFVDWRGRIYTDSGADLSFQGSDEHRALCQYSEYKAVNRRARRFATKVIRAEYGDHVADHYHAIVADPEAFVRSYQGKKWCALAAAFALEEAERTGQSRYILQQDASCSGFQHISLIMGDAELAECTNVTGDGSGDLYTRAAHAIADLGLDQLNGQVADLLKSQWALITSRNAAKKVVMLTGYGSSARGIAIGWLTDLGYEVAIVGTGSDKALTITDAPAAMPSDHPLFDLFAAAQFNDLDICEVAEELASLYQTALYKEFPSIERFVTLVREAARAYFNDKGHAARWPSPSGMKCVPAKTEMDEDVPAYSVQATSGATRIKVQIGGNVISTQAAGAAPNLIHSMDAALVHFAILSSQEFGIAVSPIHDSFGTHIADAERLAEIVRNQMVGIDHWDFFIEVMQGQWGRKVKAANRGTRIDNNAVLSGQHIG